MKFSPRIRIEKMTPLQYKNGGKSLRVTYSFAESSFGKIIIASTPQGITHISFAKSAAHALKNLRDAFPQATLTHKAAPLHHDAFAFFTGKKNVRTLPMHIKGTDFQHQVWAALLAIPAGTRTTYGAIAAAVGRPLATRAVGTAIGQNQIAYIIPCHRVVPSSGSIGNYRWGNERKIALLASESSV